MMDDPAAKTRSAVWNRAALILVFLSLGSLGNVPDPGFKTGAPSAGTASTAN